MSDKPPKDKSLEAIKNHKSAKNYDMNGPAASALRQGLANERVNRDKSRYDNVNRAEKHVKVEKEKIATEQDMLAGKRGLLSKEFNKSAKEREP